MQQNLFFPVYKQLEKELDELSYFITFDKKQLKTYSIKISELLLRTVSEIENISKELCKREKIKFYDKNKHIRKVVYFNDYFEKLEHIFLLSKKYVSFDLDNCNENIFDVKLVPFKKDKTYTLNGKTKSIWSWYYAYNKIKHDRVKFFRYANLECLIKALAALFLLNIYYLNKTFYSETSYDTDYILEKIEGFSKIFSVDYTIAIPDDERISPNLKDTFFNPIEFFRIGRESSTYLLYSDYVIRTSSDEAADMLDKLEGSVHIFNSETHTFRKKYDNYQYTEHTTQCKLVAKLNREIDVQK